MFAHTPNNKRLDHLRGETDEKKEFEPFDSSLIDDGNAGIE